jgi:tetratricopeptide (TPR) repeat protein
MTGRLIRHRRRRRISVVTGVGWRRRAARRAAAIAAAAVLGLALPPLAAATDPFYRDLLHDGIQADERGDHAAAARQLRLACFGMLDEPDELAACLVRLGLAEGAAGNAEDFRNAFRRLVQIEDRFGAYSRAALPAEVRAAFEQRAVAMVPATTLEALPKWKALLGRKLEAEIAALPPKERRRQLEERVAKEPRNVAWNLMLADLDLAEGRTAQATTRAEQLAALAPQEPRALCLRGLVRSEVGRCREGLGDLEPCYLCVREVRYATALLACRVELGRWRDAEEQVRALPAGFKDDRKLAGLVQQVARHQGATGGGAASRPITGARAGTDGVAGPPTSRGQASTTATSPGGRPAAGAGTAPAMPARPAAGTPGAIASNSPHPLSAAERDTMARAEKLLAANTTRDLREALRLAGELADAHPDAKEAQYLAGEAAYRNSRWTDAAAYFRRAGPPGDDRPELLFYMAVALYQVGDQPGAAAALKRSLPNLQKTSYVQDYVKRILGE